MAHMRSRDSPWYRIKMKVIQVMKKKMKWIYLTRWNITPTRWRLDLGEQGLQLLSVSGNGWRWRGSTPHSLGARRCQHILDSKLLTEVPQARWSTNWMRDLLHIQDVPACVRSFQCLNSMPEIMQDKKSQWKAATKELRKQAKSIKIYRTCKATGLILLLVTWVHTWTPKLHPIEWMRCHLQFITKRLQTISKNSWVLHKYKGIKSIKKQTALQKVEPWLGHSRLPTIRLSQVRGSNPIFMAGKAKCRGRRHPAAHLEHRTVKMDVKTEAIL